MSSSRYLLYKAGIFLLLFAAAISTGCIKVKQSSTTPRLLKAESATEADLVAEVNRFARVNSMRAKMALKFEDNSFAEFGSKEVYRSANGEIVVQRPAKILMKVQVPVIGSDVAQMTSDGTHFRVAILQDGGSGKYKKFVKGTNDADYSRLQKEFDAADLENGKQIKKSVNAFANLRPQHFTEAMLVRPTDANHVYAISSIYQQEGDGKQPVRSPVKSVVRPYYLLDEFAKLPDGTMRITRRFWFDRVAGIRLARQQIFDKMAEIESDIVYGAPGSLTSTGEYSNLPLEIQVTRPKEHYSMRLLYQSPESVKIGDKYPDEAFVLENSWGLEEVDLDQKLAALGSTPTAAPEPKTSSTTRSQ